MSPSQAPAPWHYPVVDLSTRASANGEAYPRQRVGPAGYLLAITIGASLGALLAHALF